MGTDVNNSSSEMEQQQQRDMNSFPLEVIEKVLSNLKGEALVAASQVCWLWSCVARRIMEKESGEVFSEELLEDIRLEIEERKGDHLLDLYRETHPHLVMHSETPPAQAGFHVTAMEVDGGRVYLGNKDGQVMVFERLEGPPSCLTPEPLAATVLPDGGPVVHLGLMKAHAVLMACSPTTLYAFDAATFDEGGVAQLRLSHECVHKEMSLRVHGELVGVTAGPAHICVFRVEAVEGGQVRMRPVAEFDTPHGIFRWNIWNNQVLCVLKTGGVAVWELGEERFSLCSEPYSELRYQNPCLLFQRYVLSSSEVSRNLLSRFVYMMPTCPAAYWHVSCGPAYWLFGRLDLPRPHPQKFPGVLPPDVTALAARRRLLACATRDPYKVTVYALPADAPHDLATLTLSLQTPLLTIPATEHVLHLDIAFEDAFVHLFAFTQPGSLFCYTLKR